MPVDRLQVAAVGRAASFDISGLIWTLTRTHFKTRYHGTLVGFVWALKTGGDVCGVVRRLFVRVQTPE